MCSAGFVAATACGAMGDFQACDPALPARLRDAGRAGAGLSLANGGRQALRLPRGRLRAGQPTVLAYSELNATPDNVVSAVVPCERSVACAQRSTTSLLILLRLPGLLRPTVHAAAAAGAGAAGPAAAAAAAGSEQPPPPPPASSWQDAARRRRRWRSPRRRPRRAGRGRRRRRRRHRRPRRAGRGRRRRRPRSDVQRPGLRRRQRRGRGQQRPVDRRLL